ncbi:MAG: galactose-1-phosphate uridylyltransferase [Candidatus Bathyarchaeia archaeon]
MRRISFVKEVYEARLRSPLTGFKLESQPIEYRVDPLTGMVCRINIRRSMRVRQATEAERNRAIQVSRGDCPFCPGNIQRMTPLLPRGFAEEGRLRVGSAVLFPNMYPFSIYHAVAVFTGEHNPNLCDIHPEAIRDCLKVSVEFLRLAYMRDPRIKYGSVNWNYMHPAGASIVHPHLQVIGDVKPTLLQEKLLEGSRTYYERNGGNYWLDLVEAEVELGERLIHRDGFAAWLASFAPQGNNEVLGILPEYSSILELKQGGLDALSKGLAGILKAYHDLGVESFNMAVFSGPLDEHLDYYSLNLRIISRPRVEAYYTSDCGFMERLHMENIVESRPEELAEKLRSYLT